VNERNSGGFLVSKKRNQDRTSLPAPFGASLARSSRRQPARASRPSEIHKNQQRTRPFPSPRAQRGIIQHTTLPPEALGLLARSTSEAGSPPPAGTGSRPVILHPRPEQRGFFWRLTRPNRLMTSEPDFLLTPAGPRTPARFGHTPIEASVARALAGNAAGFLFHFSFAYRLPVPETFSRPNGRAPAAPYFRPLAPSSPPSSPDRGSVRARRPDPRPGPNAPESRDRTWRIVPWGVPERERLWAPLLEAREKKITPRPPSSSRASDRRPNF